MGVIAPRARTPEMLSAYKLPEKIMIPASSSQPAQLTSAELPVHSARMPTRINPSA